MRSESDDVSDRDDARYELVIEHKVAPKVDVSTDLLGLGLVLVRLEEELGKNLAFNTKRIFRGEHLLKKNLGSVALSYVD